MEPLERRGERARVARDVSHVRVIFFCRDGCTITACFSGVLRSHNQGGNSRKLFDFSTVSLFLLPRCVWTCLRVILIEIKY